MGNYVLKENVYVIQDRGITCLNYKSVVEYLADKHGMRVEDIERMLRMFGTLTVGPDTIRYKKGDKLASGYGDVTVLEEPKRVLYVDIILVGQEYWTNNVIYTYNKNEKIIADEL